MTKKEAAIISAYTGVLCCKFSDMHEYIESIMGEPVFTHQLGNKEYAETVKQASKRDFIELCESLTD